MFEAIRSLLGFAPRRSEADEQIAGALATARLLDHYFFFSDQANLEAAAARLEQRGWTIVSMSLDGAEQRYLLHARQQGTVENLQQLQTELDRFADEHNGQYDGWQVPGATEHL